ncbi:MAG: response regulator [Syntrophales bacterium]|nr:response regulator [Syntrophales bacterium]
MAIILQNESDFRIYLTGQHNAKAPRTGRKVPLVIKAQILYVGEDRQTVELGRNLLEDLGYRVTALTNIFRAWEEFCSRSQEFDLVVTDLNMPLLTGVELATEMVKIRPDLSIIICLGREESVPPEIARKLNVRELLRKPAGITDFIGAIRRALNCPREEQSQIIGS